MIAPWLCPLPILAPRGGAASMLFQPGHARVRAPLKGVPMRFAPLSVCLIVSATWLGGCAAVSAVTTVAGAATSVAGAAVDVTTGAVGVAADGVGAAADAATGSSDSDSDDSGKKKPN